MTSKLTSAPRPSVSPRTARTVSPSTVANDVDGVGGAELPRELELRGLHVDGDDLARARDAGALDHVQADATAPDDRDGVARCDVGGVQRGTDAGEHPASEQGREPEREVVGDLHDADRGHDGELGERPRERHLLECFAV